MQKFRSFSISGRFFWIIVLNTGSVHYFVFLLQQTMHIFFLRGWSSTSATSSLIHFAALCHLYSLGIFPCVALMPLINFHLSPFSLGCLASYLYLWHNFVFFFHSFPKFNTYTIFHFSLLFFFHLFLVIKFLTKGGFSYT